MSILSDIEAKISVSAAQAVAVILDEGAHLGVELVADAKELGQQILAAAKAELDKVEGQVQDSFLSLTHRLGDVASQFVANLWPDTSLSGNEKANLAATQLVQEAAQQGITIAEQDVSALIKTSYLGVKDFIDQLTVKAASAL